MNAMQGRLQGCRVLVVEDEYMLAQEMVRALEDEGAEVLGPVSSVTEACILAREGRPVAALLDVNLNGEMIWPVLDALLVRSVLTVLVTGYDESFIPATYGHLPRFEKPVSLRDVTRALHRATT